MAACRGIDTAHFFDGGDTTVIDVCRTCRVAGRYLDYALDHGLADGVWGRLDPDLEAALASWALPGGDDIVAVSFLSLFGILTTQATTGAVVSTMEAPPGTVVVPVTDDAAARQAELVNRARAELLGSGTAVTLDEIATATGRTRAAVSKAVERHRRAGRIVAVVHDRATLVPTFQLDEAFDVDADVAKIVGRLVDAGMSAWAVWRWAVSPNTWLFGDRPADRIASGDLAAVHEAIDGLLQS